MTNIIRLTVEKDLSISTTRPWFVVLNDPNLVGGKMTLNYTGFKTKKEAVAEMGENENRVLSRGFSEDIRTYLVNGSLRYITTRGNEYIPA